MSAPGAVANVYTKQAIEIEEGDVRGRSLRKFAGAIPTERLSVSPILGLAEFLDVGTWAARKLPEPIKLLGDLVTSGSRMFLVGSTGLGKTMVGLALAAGMANGAGFLHWRATRPSKVLYVDGEMSSQLIKVRAAAELARCIVAPKPGTLIIYARDFDEQTSDEFPKLGKMPPLNTVEGEEFLHKLIDAVGGVDVVIFDNVMSLTIGDQKDEVTWSEASPLVASLSARNIAQIWFDHTGHDKTRQYGASSKAWRFDTVGIMTPLPKTDQRQNELAFQLSFESPGKARRRTPDNRADFETCIIRLEDDQWTGDRTPESKPIKAKVSPTALAVHGALLDALTMTDTPGSTTRDRWYAEAVRLGLMDAFGEADTQKTRDAKRARLRKYITELKAAGWIGVDGETVRSVRNAG